jgi:hypothetical protein
MLSYNAVREPPFLQLFFQVSTSPHARPPPGGSSSAQVGLSAGAKVQQYESCKSNQRGAVIRINQTLTLAPNQATVC